MKTLLILAVATSASVPLWADFSYTSMAKRPSDARPSVLNQTTKTYLKGQKMKFDYGDLSAILDFDTQTITYLSTTEKTYNVSTFTDLGRAAKQSGVEIAVDVKETGQHKMTNGYSATLVILTGDVAIAGMKSRMESEYWISSDVPGIREMIAFYKRNADRFPWLAMAGGNGHADQSMQNAMSAFYRKIAAMNGVVVLQVLKSSGVDTSDMREMKQLSKQMDELSKQGNLPPQLRQELAKMKSASGRGATSDLVIESSGFSNAPIPDSVFAIPQGYRKR